MMPISELLLSKQQNISHDPFKDEKIKVIRWIPSIITFLFSVKKKEQIHVLEGIYGTLVSFLFSSSTQLCLDKGINPHVPFSKNLFIFTF
jgi:hypothetical protein